MEPVENRGNCFAACLASILEMGIEDVIQIQEYYHQVDWSEVLQEWLNSKGYSFRCATIDEIRSTDKYILVSGTCPRDGNINHIVIYKDGVMVHDPHPENTGIVDHQTFHIIDKF